MGIYCLRELRMSDGKGPQPSLPYSMVSQRAPRQFSREEERVTRFDTNYFPPVTSRKVPVVKEAS